MAKRLQHRGGTTSQHGSFTGAVREVTVDTDKKTLVVHDGSTAGGFEISRADGSNVTNFAVGGTITSAVNGTMSNLDLDNDADTPFMTFKESGAVNFFIGESSIIGGGGAGYYDFYGASGIGQRFFTNALERLRIDSSGRMLLGTTTEGETSGDDLTIATTGSTGITIRSGTTSNGIVYFSDGTSGADEYRGYIIYNHSDNSMKFATNATERMRIDTSGNVGIGTTSPQGKLSVSNGTIFVGSEANTTQTNNLLNGYGYRIGSTIYGSVSVRSSYNNGNNQASLEFYTAGSDGSNERIRIDTSGNLLIGKTAANSTDVGFFFSGSGTGASFVRAGSATQPNLILNKKTNDGIIVDLRKDNTTVGSIATNGGRPSFINSTYGGLKIGTGYSVDPATTAGAGWDNSIDLGAGGTRWKNLYLSGGVFLGGTGTANQLDDYEEGTWTPVYENDGSSGYATQIGTYTKIGQLVTAYFSVVLNNNQIGGNNLRLTGLPFTASNPSGNYGATSGMHMNGWSSSANKPDNGLVPTNSTYIDLYHSQGTTGTNIPTGSNLGTGSLIGFVTYRAA